MFSVFPDTEKPSIVTHPQSVAPKEGDTVALRCNATGSPLLHIFWTLDGSVMVENESSRIILSNDSQELTITNVRRVDSGEYRCVVKNRVGNDTSNPSVVNVLCKYSIGILFTLGNRTCQVKPNFRQFKVLAVTNELWMNFRSRSLWSN